MNRILVIGATGNVGRHVVCQVMATGADVRILARNPERAKLLAGVEVARGDLRAPETLGDCLNDIDAVFLVWTAPPDTVAPVIERIANHARRIVFLSSPHNVAHPFFQRPQPNPVAALHRSIEQSVVASEIEWTFLRPGMFAVNALHWWGPQIRAGDVVRWPYLAAPTAPIDERDIAAVAVRALCEDGHAGAEYVLTGAESLTQREQVSAIGRAIGRPLHLEDVPPGQARSELFASWPAPVVDMLLAAWEGAMGRLALVTSTVADLTGSPARTFYEWATDHAGEFQASAGSGN